jgi:hypothetical protein
MHIVVARFDHKMHFLGHNFLELVVPKGLKVLERQTQRLR